jgi:hypothetical protein
MLLHLYRNSKTILLSLLCLTISFAGKAQQLSLVFQQDTTASHLQIIPPTILKWDDFFKIISEDKSYAALTNTQTEIGVKSKTEGNTTTATIRTKFYFDKVLSCKKQSALLPKLLSHEQMHLNLAHANYLFFLQSLKTKNYTAKNYREIIDSSFVEYQRNNFAWQSRYDLETAHGRDSTEQARWKKVITDLYNKAQEDKDVYSFSVKPNATANKKTNSKSNISVSSNKTKKK